MTQSSQMVPPVGHVSLLPFPVQAPWNNNHTFKKIWNSLEGEDRQDTGGCRKSVERITTKAGRDSIPEALGELRKRQSGGEIEGWVQQ